MRINETDEKVTYNQLATTILEIWAGTGDTFEEIFETVKLDRESRRYLHVKVKNRLNAYSRLDAHNHDYDEEEISKI